jgi:hypothetical protein
MITERNAQIAIANYFEYRRNIVIPSFYFHGYECDVFIMTKSGYITEVEIKLNINDLKIDKNKSKWNCESRRHIKKFYYAVPRQIIEDAKSIIDEKYGILSLQYNEPKQRCFAYLHKEASILNKSKPEIIDSVKLKMLLSSYHRFWALHTTRN